MSSTTQLTDTLPSTVPRLDANGANWVIFSLRFRYAVEAKGFWGHFDGTSIRPANPTSAKPEDLPTDEQKAWDKNERSANSLLIQKIPDSTLVRIHAKTNVQERWKAIEKEYTVKGAYAQTEMWSKFLEMRCPEKGNVREFLDTLRVKRKELASVGVDIDVKDYRSTILSSLPTSLANFASAQLAAARYLSTTNMIDPDSLIAMISEEYDRLVSRHQAKEKEKGKKAEGDEALAVGSGGGGRDKGKGKGKRPPKGACWNCKETGHYRDKCPHPKRTPESSLSSSAKKDEAGGTSGSANVVDYDSDSVGAFAVGCETDSEVEDYFDSDSASGGEGGWNWEEDWFTEEESDDEGRTLGSVAVVDEDEDSDDSPNVCTVGASIDHVPHIDLFDSGSTRHISPYCDSFMSFTEITPHFLRAANKQSFSATGVGKCILDIPNRNSSTKLPLHDVLYAKDVGYSLVSIGRLDEMGYTTHFGDGKCVIHDPKGRKVGKIKRDSKALYRVVREEGCDEYINAAIETVSLEELHNRMGHISPDVARRLVNDGLVSGLHLSSNEKQSFHCDSCVYAKAGRKPVLKAREGGQAKAFGDEV